jgi:hypothetical protein
MNYEQLEEEGYIIFKDVIDPKDLEYGLSCFSEDKKINYHKMKNYIENIMLGIVNKKMDWKCDYIKYRVSDKNNSADASTFHRDVIAQTEYRIPVFTCLSYLNPTVMELIPGSHKNSAIPFSELYRTYNSRKLIQINPTDILLFYGSMLHRGIFFHNQNKQSRKVIQVFEVFPTTDILLRYKDNLLHVGGKETYREAIQKISEYSSTIYLINLLGYINAASGYGKLPEQYKDKNTLYLSSEGLCGRETVDPNQTWQTQNKYIIKYDTKLLDKNHKKHFDYHCYNKKIYLTSFIGLLFIFIIICLFLALAKKMKNKLRKNSISK